MIRITILLLLFSVALNVATNLSEIQEKFIMDFTESFNTPHCIIVVEESDFQNHLAYSKRFSLMNRYLVFMTETQLYEYILAENFANVKTAVIYKTLERETLAQFLRQLKRVSKSRHFDYALNLIHDFRK